MGGSGHFGQYLALHLLHFAQPLAEMAEVAKGKGQDIIIVVVLKVAALRVLVPAERRVVLVAVNVVRPNVNDNLLHRLLEVHSGNVLRQNVVFVLQVLVQQVQQQLIHKIKLNLHLSAQPQPPHDTAHTQPCSTTTHSAKLYPKHQTKYVIVLLQNCQDMPS